MVKMYEREIKNGVTIIKTGDATGGLKNKSGFRGVTYYKDIKKYRAEITLNRKKYCLGFFDSLEHAKKIRLEAESHKASEDFLEWFDTLDKYHYQKLDKAGKAAYSRKNH